MRHHYESNTAQVTTVSLAMDQILGTALLLIVILSVTDGENMKITSSLVPITIGLGLTAIHLSFGLNAGSAINPARDFGPRLLTFLAGWKDPFKVNSRKRWLSMKGLYVRPGTAGAGCRGCCRTLAGWSGRWCTSSWWPSTIQLRQAGRAKGIFYKRNIYIFTYNVGKLKQGKYICTLH
jgi:glycerol uptake facilitator-like aquaporin